MGVLKIVKNSHKLNRANHAIRRAKERYNMDLEFKDLMSIAKLIKEGKFRRKSYAAGNANLYHLVFRKRLIKAVFDYNTNDIATFLPTYFGDRIMSFSYSKQIINSVQGDNYFHYLNLWINLKRLNNEITNEEVQWFKDEANRCHNKDTGYILRRTNAIYPNADKLEMSHDELSAISALASPELVEDLERRLNKQRGFYLSHSRNRTWMGLYMGCIASIKLRNDLKLSLPWQVLWSLTAAFSNESDPSSMVLLFNLVENYRNQPFRGKLMTWTANKAIAKLNKAGLRNVMEAFWKENATPFAVLAHGITIDKIN